MVESSKGQHEELEDDEEVGTHRGKSREKNRTKHSETEQRRRSKINERFQILRNLIPQNDQKRDKASFLLEVIDYIRFLQEKLNKSEASHQGWSSEPRKSTPWKNDHMAITEGFADANQVFKNGPDCQNNVPVSHSLLRNPHSSLEPDIGSAMVYKTLDHLSGSAMQSVPLTVQQSNIFGVSSQALRESVSDIVTTVDSLPQSHPESWQGLNDTPTSQDEKSGSVSVSNSYSQGVLDTLTQALRSSGVDMSQASISVQIDVVTRTDSGLISMSSSSKANVNRPLENQLMENSQSTTTIDKYEQAHKRLRIDQ